MGGLVLDVLYRTTGLVQRMQSMKNRSVILVLAVMFDNLSRIYLWTVPANLLETLGSTSFLPIKD